MINKPERMSFNRDCSSALHLLEHIQQTINNTADTQLQAQTVDDINMLISVFSNPVLRNMVSVEDSLSELNQQLQQHPSILPVDLYITPSGELTLNVVPPDEIFDAPYDPKYIQRQEFDDQQVPVAKLSNSSSTDTSTSPQIGTPRSGNGTMPPITTQTYAIEFQKAIEESSHGRDIINVQLFKPEGSSLGFSVVGLRSEEKGELGIYVQEIQNSGIAGRDGNLREGDQILAIDGQPLDSNISHQQAISILQKARGLVELVVARGVEEENPQTPPVARSPSAVSDTSKSGSDMVLNTEWAQVEVIDLVNDGSGLGFGIIGGRSTGVVVKTILPGGVADRDGRLQSGDHILQIGDVNLRGMGSEQVAAVLRQSGSHVRLVVARPIEPTSPEYQALGSQVPIVPTKILGDPEELDRHLLQNACSETFSRQTPILDSYNDHFVYRENEADIELHPQASLVVDAIRNPVVTSSMPLLTTPLPVLTMDMLSLESSALPEMEKFTVELKKDLYGLGITIAGYVCEKEELSGIFVKSISEGSSADLCKKIQVNDRIVEVDGRSLQGYTNHQAVEVLRSTGQTVRLCLERYLRGPKFEQLQQAIAASELKPTAPSSPSAASLPRFPVSTDGESTMEIEIEGESHTTSDSIVLENLENSNIDIELQELELLIDDDYEGTLKSTVEAAIQAKWSKIIGNDCDIIVAQLCKLSEGGGLGISLEGTVDVEHGQEVRPHHYIRSILPEGPVGRNGRLQSGDELLEVNGYRLLGMNHIEVVSILKDLPMSVRMVCSRRNDDTLPHRLINTSQDRAAFAARSILGGSLQNLIPATARLVKAKSDGSLASTATTTTATDAGSSKMKSRSLEPLTGLAMWSSEPQIIELVKGERGLGFSILDYQDPMNPNETVIVIRSLVPGGVAQMDGQLIPGDRLLFVNDTNLENASLDHAVQVLKGAPKGIVRIGVAKPLPIPDSISHSQKGLDDFSQNTPTLDDHSMFSSYESLSPSQLKDEKADLIVEEAEEILGTTTKRREKGEDNIGQSDEDRLSNGKIPENQYNTDAELEKSAEEELPSDLLQLMIVPVASERAIYQRTPSTGDITDDDLEEEDFQSGWASDVIHLPPSIEVEIRVHKGTEPLGISIDSVDKGVNGMLVVLVVPGGAVARDGHIRPGDYLISVNHETLRKVTNSQARAILRRAQLLSTDISVTYIPGEAAAAYRKSIQQESQTPPLTKIVRTSPRSPYIPSDNSIESSDERDRESLLQLNQLKKSSAVSGGTCLIERDAIETVTKQSNIESSKSGGEQFPSSQVPSSSDGDDFQKSQILSPLNVDSLLKNVESPAAYISSKGRGTLPCSVPPSERSNKEVLEKRFLKPPRSENKRGPLSVCVVDGLYSVQSPKGNKVLVGVELSTRDVGSKGRKTVLSGSKQWDEKTVGYKKSAFTQKELICTPRERKLVKKLNLIDKASSSVDIEDVKQTPTIKEFSKRFKSLATEETAYKSSSKDSEIFTSFSETIIQDTYVKVNIVSDTIDSDTDVKTKIQKTAVAVKEEILLSIDDEVRKVETEKDTEIKDEFPVKCESLKSQTDKLLQKEKQPQEKFVVRIPSFECTCEQVLSKASPEKECSCFSSDGTIIVPMITPTRQISRLSHVDMQKVTSCTSESSSYHTNQELLNTENNISSEEEFKSEATSTFYSPKGDSPEMIVEKQTIKMDKEVSANILLAKHWGPERYVEVIREPNCSLGISIVGGKVDLYNAGPDSSSAILGIFIKNVLPNSPAGRMGELKTGDRILEVDSIDLRSASHEKAVEVIRSSGERVRFLVQSLIQWSVEEKPKPTPLSSTSIGKGEAADSEKSPLVENDSKEVPNEKIHSNIEIADRETFETSSGSVNKSESIELVKDENCEAPVQEYAAEKATGSTESEDENDDEDEDEDYEYRDLEGKMFTAKGEEIFRSSAGNVKRTKEEIAADPDEEDQFGYTTNKAKKKYSNLGETVQIVHLERSHRGLGISLAGHKDRNRMAVFVCGLNPNGTAYKTGGIQVGDEILEVNGIVLHGRCHLNASAIIKGLSGPTFKVVILRRPTALEELAVKPITHFPISLDDEEPEQRYANFKGLRTVTIKKGNQNLGIMIIEGKHAEVGQGIFISDIQERSAAEQAGLLVGDMILAVNKDTLIGSSYDAAATLLKKTEGIVTLVVCNPNKVREEEREATAGNSLDAKVSESQSISPIPTLNKEAEKQNLISFSALKTLKSSSPSKQLPEIMNSTASMNAHVSDTSCLTTFNTLLPATGLTPATSPALSLRKSSSGKIAEEPSPDPGTCPIVPGKEITIEILKDKIGLGLGIVGGCDTLLGSILVHEIYPGGAAAKDGRLQPGDQILEFNSEDFRNVTHTKALETTWLTLTKIKMVVYRDESLNQDDLLEVIDVELNRKPGKGLGLSVTLSSKGKGVFISDIVHGGVAEVDGRLMKGDYILEINGENLKDCDIRTAAVAMKICTGRIMIKIGRIKCKKVQNTANGKNACIQPLTIVNVPSVQLNGIPEDEKQVDEEKLDDLIEGCFPTRKTSMLRNFARTFSIRKRNN